MLCPRCQDCFQSRDRPANATACRFSIHHQTFQSLMQSIEEGCFICNRFWETLSAQERQSFSSTLGKGVRAQGAACAAELAEDYVTRAQFLDNGRHFGHTGCYLLEVGCRKSAVHYPSTSEITFWKAHFLFEPVESASQRLEVQSLSTSTRSPQTRSLARDWIKECTTSHERCKVAVTKKLWYPTRLLFFDHEASVVRLIETGQTTPVGQYMTLTHRWGPVDQIVLTKDTYPQLLDGIPLSTLPQVFQDAMSICNDLGIHYIWADSLCIFQGKENILDWQHEASLMGEVYSNSFCNISAADTADCSQSIFQNRDPRTTTPPTVDLTVHTSENAKGTQRFVLHDRQFWETEVTEALVNKRAWVLQERFLAPRILHFGRRQLLWECPEKDAAEVYPDGVPLVLSTTTHSRFKQLNPSEYINRITLYRDDDTEGISAPHLLWSRIVQHYTASELTFPSDKLIACSGIARRLAKILQDDYVAGMWRQYLESELLWSVQGNHQPGRWTRPDEYRAPSWSWASIDGPIWPGQPGNLDCPLIIEDYHLDYWTDDKFAAIKDGWLRLRGVLKKIALIRKSQALGEGYHWDMMLDGEEVNTQEDVPSNKTAPQVKLDILQEDFEEENAKGLLFCMSANWPKNDEGIRLILLLKAVEGETGTFRRIGIAWTCSNKVKQKILAKVPEESQLPCLLYEDGLHSICII